jgi:phosphoglycerate dehydrogenase-like enzyme
MLKALYIMNPEEWNLIYPSRVHAELSRMVCMLAPVLSPKQALMRPDLLSEMDILISGWGGPMLNHQFLELAPKLQAVFYGAGTIGYMLSDAFWKRNLVATTANAINAIPVAEFTVAHISLGLKQAWRQALETKKRRPSTFNRLPVAGGYQSTVGIISLSTIGRLVRQRLEYFDVQVNAYDPTVDDQEGLNLGVKMVSLEKMFADSDVVSLHAPLVPETEGMITGSLFASMKEGATFINTARGSIVREQEMIEVLQVRPDLTAILDVTDPEPPQQNSPLFDLPNVIVTPHIAGSLDGECARMGRWMVDELQRYLVGKPLLGRVLRIQKSAIGEVKGRQIGNQNAANQ